MKTLLERARAGKPLDIDIIDMHGHIGRFAFAIPDLSPQRLVESMDRLGVSAIACSHMRCMSLDVEYGNAEILKAMQAFPGRILGYISAYPSDAQRVRQSVRRWVDEGFIGMKLHNLHNEAFPYTDPAYEPAYEIADEKRLVLLFHTGGDENEFEEIRSLSQRYPQASFLLAHAGAHNEEGYVRIARDCPNVYLELCYSTAQRGLTARLVAGAGVEKVIWGSDGYFHSQAAQLGKVIGADMHDDAKVKILSTNARRLLDGIKNVE